MKSDGKEKEQKLSCFFANMFLHTDFPRSLPSFFEGIREGNILSSFNLFCHLVSFAIQDYRKRGKITIPCQVCTSLNDFEDELGKCQDGEKIFIVLHKRFGKSIHATTVYVKKNHSETEVLITDSLGFRKFLILDSELLSSIYKKISKAKVTICEEQRENDSKSCFLFSLMDAKHISTLRKKGISIFKGELSSLVNIIKQLAIHVIFLLGTLILFPFLMKRHSATNLCMGVQGLFSSIGHLFWLAMHTSRQLFSISLRFFPSKMIGAMQSKSFLDKLPNKDPYLMRKMKKNFLLLEGQTKPKNCSAALKAAKLFARFVVQDKFLKDKLNKSILQISRIF